uniref:Beta-1,4-galactosyltransferase n=1 Tax=Schistosoma mansoni TaxID=6183 RepID=A0A5K4FBZ5_SCHMA
MFSKKKSSFRIYCAISKAVGLIFCTIFLLQIYFMRTTVNYVTLQNLTAEAIIPSNTTLDVCKQTCRTICKNIDSVPSSKVNALKPMGKMPFTGEFNEEMNPINDTFYPQSLDGSWMFKEETTDCSNVPQSGVAIIIVCRDRWKQLNNTLSSLIPVLQRQHLCYRIFVIEQKGTGILNKARLMNVGFIEARKRFYFNCAIFHDADLIPLDDRIPHGCDEETMESVVHLSVGVSTWNYILPYKSLIGGVLKISSAQFIQVNGYSNSYWGWGGEDDDLERRLKASNIVYKHIEKSIGRYLAQPHDKQVKGNIRSVLDLLENAVSRMLTDGLNSVKYKVSTYFEKQHYTYFLISLE